MMRSFTVPGKPQGKGRPRFSGRNGIVRTFTPPRTAEYEEQIAMAYRAKYGDSFGEAPMGMIVTAVMPIPKSATRIAKIFMASGWTRPTVKPDCDNILKVVADALNGVAYDDDKQLVEVSVQKVYGEKPGLTVVLYDLLPEVTA